ARQSLIIVSGGPGHPGHSFCALSPHDPNALCGVPVSESFFDSPSTHGSADVHGAYGGSESVARYLLISSTHVTRAAATGSLGPVSTTTVPVSSGGGVPVSTGGGGVVSALGVVSPLDVPLSVGCDAESPPPPSVSPPAIASRSFVPPPIS